ncbi:hypothetical protein HHL08_15885 [Sphingobium sp. AR-3-1]|uniref:Uncharacterized protein n=1 Tax=Sphingobium psychrophilum TaxID=2728834 RepID=A0A7X9WXA7_9SPHN|nr:hypothetical protein [Sphingobium psychrophilum]NML11611.1 hypothetical protein [Sphingobium psychrophilum]
MTDDEIEAELATLSDEDLIKVWMDAPDSEHPTRREELALGMMELRNVDF